MRVSNRKAVRRLAWRSFRANRVRNIVAVIAMVLTTVLFTSLFTAVFGLSHSMQELLMREYGTSSHGSFDGITEAQQKQLSSHSLIKKYGSNLLLTYLTEEDFAVRNAEVGYYDSEAAKMSYCYPTTGSLPKEKYELATETAILDKLGVTPKLGEAVTLTLTDPISEEKITQTFTLCGYWDTDPILPSGKILLSKDYVTEQLNNSYAKTEEKTIRNWCLQVMCSSSNNAEDKMITIAKDNGYQVEDDTKDDYIYIHMNIGYMSLQMNKDNSIWYAAAAISLLILFTGYLIIYNIFLISVSRDIRFYGLLKTIGTTGRQIKRIIRYQAVLLGLLGMPLGLFLGYIIGIRITPLFMSSMNYSSYQKLDPIVFLLAAAFSLITVLISIRKPGKAAAKVSPVEALRYTEGSQKRKISKRSKHGARIYRMALSNLFRSKKKAFLVFVSLSMSIILLNIVFSISKGFDVDKLIGQMSVSDYTIGSTNYFESKYREDVDGVSEDIIAKASKQEGIQGSGRVYYDTKQAVVDYSQEMIDFTFAGMNPQDITNTLYHIGGSDKNQWDIQLYGMDDFILDKLEVVEGSLDKDKFKSGDYILQVVGTDDYNNADLDSANYRVGDKVTVHYIDEPVTDTQEAKYHSKTYEVMAVVKESIGWNVKYYYASAMILSSDNFVKETGVKATMAYLMDVNDESEPAMDQFLKSYADTVNTEMSYESKTTLIHMFIKYRDAFVAVGEALSLLVGIIGILNFANLMLTGIVMRKREFASLRSIGMTGRQLKTLLIMEGSFYAVISILIAAAGSTLINLTLIKSLEGGIWFFTAQFTLLPVIIVTPILLFFGICVPYLTYHVNQKQSIVEQLRVSE